MTEEQLQELNFVREDIDEYEGDETYYYVLNLVDGLTFITEANDEVKNNDWSVEVFDTNPPLKFNNFEDLKMLINILKKGVNND